MSGDAAQMEVEIKNWRLEKKNARGEVFEVIEAREGKEPRVVLHKPGEPEESYSALPFPSEGE
jgi:hypothetical protein